MPGVLKPGTADDRRRRRQGRHTPAWVATQTFCSYDDRLIEGGRIYQQRPLDGRVRSFILDEPVAVCPAWGTICRQ
jgi:hypothetical protein